MYLHYGKKRCPGLPEPLPSRPGRSVLSASSPTAGQTEPEHGSSERSPTALCFCKTRGEWKETLLNFLGCHWAMSAKFHYCPFCGLPLPSADYDTVWGEDR